MTCIISCYVIEEYNNPPDFFPYIPGYVIEEHNNPPDFFLDVISGDFNVDVDTIDLEETKKGTEIQCRAINE